MDATRFAEDVLALGVATQDQLSQASAMEGPWRTLAARLVEVGCRADDVLSALSSACMLPSAPPTRLRGASYLAVEGMDLAMWRSIGAVPMGRGDDGTLHVLVLSDDALRAVEQTGAGPVRGFVALEHDIEGLLGEALQRESTDGLLVHDAQSQLEIAGGDEAPAAPTMDVLSLPGQAASASDEMELMAAHEQMAEMSGLEVDTDRSGTPSMESAPEGLVHEAHEQLQASAPSAPAAAPAPAAEQGTGGRSVCGYEVFEELGRGASAIVFRARRPGESDDVALKVITKEAAADPGFPQRFKREIRSQASLTHANIVQVVDYGREEGWYYLATEFLPLGTLETLFESNGTVPGPIAACLLDDMLRGLSFAQQRGVVHRDLKPGNLLLSPDGHVKIGDFGLARTELDPNRSSHGQVRGTPSYMSPEQALGLDVDGRSDLFTVATIIYELITGGNPYRRDQGPATIMAVAHAVPLNLFEAAPGVSLVLDEVVASLNRKELEQRPESADNVLPMLRPLVEESARRWPGLVSRYFASPVAVRDEIARDLCDDELVRAKEALAANDDKLRPRAALAVARALSLDPQQPEALELWQHAASNGFTRGEALRPELVQVEEQLREAPGDIRLLRRASELSRGEGNVVKQAGYLRRYLRLGQKDSLAEHQLDLLLGEISSASLRPAVLARPPTAPTQTPAPPPPAPGPFDEGSSAEIRSSARAPRPVGTGASQRLVEERPSRWPLLVGLALIVLVGGVTTFVLYAPRGAPTTAPEATKLEPLANVPDVVNPFEERQRERLEVARAHVSAARFDEAIAAFTEALHMDPASNLAVEAQLARADAYLKMGEQETAVRHYRRMIDAHPEGSDGDRIPREVLQELGVPVEGSQ